MRLPELLCTLALCSWLAPAVCRAQQAAAATETEVLRPGAVIALLPVSAEVEPAPPDVAGLAQAISDELRAHGFKLLPAQQLQNKLRDHALDSCKTAATCEPALALATLDTDAVVSSAVWLRGAAAPQLVVHVRHRTGYGQAEVSAQDAQPRSLRKAAVDALRAALTDSRHSHEVSVYIESQPSGATAHVDQTQSATTPARFALLPGSHLVSVEAPGYVTRAQYLELPEHGPSAAHLTFDLMVTQPNLAAAKPIPPPLAAAQTAPVQAPLLAATPRSSHPLDYVFGATLLGVAVPFLANAVYAGATHGDCTGRRDLAGHCAERVTLGPLFFVSLGLGVLAAVGGSAFLAFEPFSDLRTKQEASDAASQL